MARKAPPAPTQGQDRDIHEPVLCRLIDDLSPHSSTRDLAYDAADVQAAVAILNEHGISFDRLLSQVRACPVVRRRLAELVIRDGERQADRALWRALGGNEWLLALARESGSRRWSTPQREWLSALRSVLLERAPIGHLSGVVPAVKDRDITDAPVKKAIVRRTYDLLSRHRRVGPTKACQLAATFLKAAFPMSHRHMTAKLVKAATSRNP